MSDLREQIRRLFKGAERPEHVENSLRVVFFIGQEKASLSRYEWIEVFETLKRDVECDEADFVGGSDE